MQIAGKLHQTYPNPDSGSLVFPVSDTLLPRPFFVTLGCCAIQLTLFPHSQVLSLSHLSLFLRFWPFKTQLHSVLMLTSAWITDSFDKAKERPIRQVKSVKALHTPCWASKPAVVVWAWANCFPLLSDAYCYILNPSLKSTTKIPSVS